MLASSILQQKLFSKEVHGDQIIKRQAKLVISRRKSIGMDQEEGDGQVPEEPPKAMILPEMKTKSGMGKINSGIHKMVDKYQQPKTDIYQKKVKPAKIVI